jgi:hypothetical protein
MDSNLSLGAHRPEPETYLNPSTAAGLAVTGGQWIRVVTKQGSAEAKVAVREDMPNSLVRMPHRWRPEVPAGTGTLSDALRFSDAQLCPDDPDYLDAEQGIPTSKALPAASRSPEPPKSKPTIFDRETQIGVRSNCAPGEAMGSHARGGVSGGGEGPLWLHLCVGAQLPHGLRGSADFPFAEAAGHGRCNRQEPGVELAVARITFAGKPHELRAPVLRVVDEFDKPIRRQLICQPLHPLSAGGSHLGDLRHRQRTQQREASHETERTAAPARDQASFLTQRPYPEEALGDLEHQLGDRLGLPVGDWDILPISRRRTSLFSPRSLCC